VRQSTGSSTRLSEMARDTHGKIRAGLATLADQNQRLESFIMSRQVEALVTRTLPILPAGFADMQRSFDQIRDLVVVAMSMAGSGGATTDVDRALQLASVNSLLSNEQMDWKKLSDSMPDRRIEGDNLEPVGGEEDPSKVPRRLVIYESAVCLLEWNPAINADTAAKQQHARERLFNLVSRLELQDQRYLRILKPMGWVEEIDGQGARYAIIYQLPDGFDVEVDTVVCLEDLLSASRAPSLNDRIALAVAVALILRQFQSSQWLHQGIRPSNVLFVTGRGTPPERVNLRESYLTGFDFSRFVGVESDEHKDQSPQKNFYQHPLRREKGTGLHAAYRYRGEFDIYSLGRVLLDVARWKVTPDLDLDAGLAELPMTVGDAFTAAVRWCLGKSVGSPMAKLKIRQMKDLPPDAQAWSSSLISLFDDNVLHRLGQCRV
jgi:hypothetical protein